MEVSEQKFLKQTYGELSGDRLEEIIRFLASVRAYAKPAVADSAFDRVSALHLGKRDISVQGLAGGGVDMSFAHPGIGWMRVSFTSEEATNFAAKLIAAAGNPHELGARD